MTPWRWVVGYADEVEESGVYSIDDCPSREEAVAVGLRETKPGETFRIIEARFSTDLRHDGADVTPFARFRNGETIVNGPDAALSSSSGG